MPAAVPESLVSEKSVLSTPVTGSLKVTRKATLASAGPGEPPGAMPVTVGATVSTVALLVSAVVVEPPAPVAVTETLRLAPTMPSGSGWLAVHRPLVLLAATAAPPPNALKSTVTPVMPLLLSPLAELFQVALTVSPCL